MGDAEEGYSYHGAVTFYPGVAKQFKMLPLTCNSRNEGVQKRSQRHFSKRHSMLNWEIAAGWPQNVSYCNGALPASPDVFSFTCAFFFSFFFFFSVGEYKANPPAPPENHSPRPEHTSPFIKSAPPQSPHTRAREPQSCAYPPAPPERRYYSSSLGTGPHVWASESTSVTLSIIISSRMSCSWDALGRHGNARSNLCIHLTGPH